MVSVMDKYVCYSGHTIELHDQNAEHMYAEDMKKPLLDLL
jgi:hypothetical protein